MCGKQENSVQFQLGPRVFRRRHPCVWSLFGLVSWQMIQWVQRPHGSWWVKHGVVCSPINVFQVFDIQRRPSRQQHSLWETTFNHFPIPFFHFHCERHTNTWFDNQLTLKSTGIYYYFISIFGSFNNLFELSNSNKLLNYPIQTSCCLQ